MIKVALLGDSGVGKSSLLNQCTNCGFSDRYRATTRASARIKHLDIDGINHTVQIWDCAGNERLHALAPQFFHDVDVCVLVYDTTCQQSFQRLDHWLALFRTNAGDGKVMVVVGTKVDLPERRDVEREDVQDWCRQNGTVQSLEEREPLPHFQVSSKENTGVTEFLTSAVRAASLKERVSAPPPPRHTDVAWHGMSSQSPYADGRGFHQGWSPAFSSELGDDSPPPPSHHHYLQRFGQYGYSPQGPPSSSSFLQNFGTPKRGVDILALKQKLANLEAQLASAEGALLESELMADSLKHQLCDVRNQELMARLELQDRLDQVLGRLQRREEEAARAAEQAAQRIAHLEAQLAQKGSPVRAGAFGADVELEEENIHLQEENSGLKDALRRSQALVQDLQAQLQQARQRSGSNALPIPSPDPVEPRDAEIADLASTMVAGMGGGPAPSARPAT